MADQKKSGSTLGSIAGLVGSIRTLAIVGGLALLVFVVAFLAAQADMILFGGRLGAARLFTTARDIIWLVILGYIISKAFRVIGAAFAPHAPRLAALLQGWLGKRGGRGGGWSPYDEYDDIDNRYGGGGYYAAAPFGLLGLPALGHLQPPPPPVIPPALAAIPWTTVAAAVAFAVGFALVFWRLRSRRSGGSGSTTSAGTGGGWKIAIPGGLVGLVLILFFLSRFSWPGLPIPAGWAPFNLSLPQGVQDMADGAFRAGAGAPRINAVGAQARGPQAADELGLDNYPVEHARIWGDVDPIADQAMIVSVVYGPEISLTLTDTLATVDSTGSSLAVSGRLTVTQNMTDTFGLVVARMFAVTGRAENADRLSVDVWGEVRAHVETISYYALVAVAQGDLAEVPPLINQARNRLEAALGKVQAADRGCEEVTIGVITSEAEWVREKARVESCGYVVSALLIAESGAGNRNETRIKDLKVALALVKGQRDQLGTVWGAYAARNAVPTPAPLNTASPID